MWVYVGLLATLCGLMALEGSHIRTGGVLLMALLTVQMARRRSWAWAVSMLLNAVPLLGVTAAIFSTTTESADGHVVSVHHLTALNPRSISLFLILAGLQWCLWSRSMRSFIDSRHPPRQPRPRILPRFGRA